LNNPSGDNEIPPQAESLHIEEKFMYEPSFAEFEKLAKKEI